MRGQRSTTSNSPVGSCGCPLGCSDNYHFNAYPLEGRLKFEKNLKHTGGYNDPIAGDTKQNAIRKFADGSWIGLKSIVYNKPDGSVQLEWWVDEQANNNFVLKHTFNDHGQMHPRGDVSGCKHVGGNPITWGGPLCAFRNDNMNSVDLKWASIRSISPPVASATAAQATILGFEDDYINLGQLRAYQVSNLY